MYLAPWTVYGMNWSVRPDKRFRLAIGSFTEDYKNKVCAWREREREGGGGGRSLRESRFNCSFKSFNLMKIVESLSFKRRLTILTLRQRSCGSLTRLPSCQTSWLHQVTTYDCGGSMRAKSDRNACSTM